MSDAPLFSVPIDTSELVALARRLENAPEEVLQALKLAMMEASDLLVLEAQERTPTASGNLRASIIAAMPVVQGDSVIGAVVSDQNQNSHAALGAGSPLIYAVPVELGTKPHMPPLQPLMDWVKLKLGIRDMEEREQVAQKIRWKIYHHGTKGNLMFARALAVCMGRIPGIFEHHMNVAIERARGN
ncbi:MAG: HK97 gp10 family phage protein [Magnetococcales bacterium]|nr:HK97 gp10 family phage protein [Magnetococcales bacterium]